MYTLFAWYQAKSDVNVQNSAMLSKKSGSPLPPYGYTLGIMDDHHHYHLTKVFMNALHCRCKITQKANLRVGQFQYNYLWLFFDTGLGYMKKFFLAIKGAWSFCNIMSMYDHPWSTELSRGKLYAYLWATQLHVYWFYIFITSPSRRLKILKLAHDFTYNPLGLPVGCWSHVC